MAIFGPIRDVPPVEFGLGTLLRQIKQSLELLISLFTSHISAAWVEVNVFYNSWNNYDSVESTAAYFKDDHGFVHLKGMIKSGTVNSAAFLLPADCRPTQYLRFGALSNGSAGRVDITTEGWVTPMSPSNNTYVSLNGLSFYAG